MYAILSAIWRLRQIARQNGRTIDVKEAIIDEFTLGL